MAAARKDSSVGEASEKVVRLYSDTYVGKDQLTQHKLYGKQATVTDEGFLCVDLSESLAIGNVDRNFPLMSEPEYKSMLIRIEKTRR